MKNHYHQIEINEADKMISIYRIDNSGSRTLYTSTELPAITDIEAEMDKFKEFAAILGENILFDSPVVRKLYKI
ncbi:MAG: hypothetical protein AB2689_29145 [Candidatus Thiodiazotropha taylori]